MFPSDVNVIILALTALGSMLASVWLLRGFIEKRFSSIYDLVYDKIDKMDNNIVAKLEYHEKHDDDRFAQLSNQIVEIRLRNASKDILMDKLLSLHEKSEPRALGA